MLKIQQEFLDYLKEIQRNLEGSSINKDIIEQFHLGNLKELINTRELTIPIVGAFSAGKSSLINSFLEGDYLPVGITPETSLATEIRYSSNEHIEAVKADSSIVNYELSGVGQIAKDASKYKFIRLFINSDKVKSIEPLILVDMPGFDSPLDLHNQAIMEYINKGVHYIVLTSVEDGNITRSMVRQLSDIQEYDRDFSFFLSKSDIKADSEVEEIRKKVEEQIDEQFDIKKNVVVINKNGGKNLNSVLTEIDTENLFKNLFTETLKANYYTISEFINTTIVAFQKGKKDNEFAISELKKGLNDLLTKKELMIEDANNKYSDAKINSIVESAGRDISNSTDELVSIAIKSGGDAMSGTISEIIRNSLIENIKVSINDIGNDIIDDFSINLTNINGSISDFSVSDDWVEKISSSAKTLLNSVNSGLSNFGEKNKEKDGAKAIYKIATTVLAVTTGVLAPIVEIVLIFLPEILSKLFSSNKQKQQEEQIRSSILTQVIPSIKRELRAKLPEIFQKQVKELIINISTEFESIINEKQVAIENAEKEKNEDIAKIEEQVQEYKNLNDKNTKLANSALYA